VYLSNGHFDEAIVIWENAVANVPLGQSWGPVYNLAEVYLQHGYIDKAIAIPKYYINRYPEHSRLQNLLKQSLTMKDVFNKAITY
jgi:predicted Zn-dependent protease